MDIKPAVTPEIMRRRHGKILHAMVGNGRDLSIKFTREQANVPKSTFDNYLAGTHEPGLTNIGNIAQVLRADYLNAVFEPFGFTGVHEIDGSGQAPHDVLSHMCEESAQLARFLTDGRIDHLEAGELRKSLPRLISSLANLLSEVQAASE